MISLPNLSHTDTNKSARLFLKKFIGALLLATSLMASGQVIKPKVQTAFIYQFTRYIEWPNKKNLNEFKIALIGSSALQPFLEELSSQKSVNGKSISISSVEPDEDLSPFHIVIIGDSKFLEKVVQRTEGLEILTIASGEGAAAKGVIIGFFLEKEKMRFEINRSAAEKQNLSISSQLLKLARIIE